jgi:hypothetical protein
MKSEGGAEMCVIIYKPEGAIVSDKLFDRSWELFSHGGGYAVWDNGRWVYEKGFMEKEEFYKAVKEFIHSKHTRVVLHFRLATEDAEGKRNIFPNSHTLLKSNCRIQKLSYFLTGGLVNGIKALWVLQR